MTKKSKAAITKLAEVERNSKSERERIRAEVEQERSNAACQRSSSWQEREEQASKIAQARRLLKDLFALAQAEELGQQVVGLQRELEETKKELLQAEKMIETMRRSLQVRFKLLDRRRSQAVSSKFCCEAGAPRGQKHGKTDVGTTSA